MNMVVLVLALTTQEPQDTVVLKPVVVTATRVPLPADMLSSAVTVLRGSDLVADGIRAVADALQLVPGAAIVETGSYGGQTSLFMRGGESDYVKVLLDGVPLNQPGGAIDFANLTTDNIDRIEVVRGPASVLYGSDAMTGVIQIFTKTGKSGRRRVGVDLRTGTYGSSDAALDIAGGSATLSYSARLSRFFSEGLYYNNEYRNSIASARLKLVPDPRSVVRLTYRYGDDIYHIPTNSAGVPVDSNQRAAERGPQLSLDVSRVLTRHWEARIGGAVREARLFYNNEPDSPGEDGTFWSKDWVRRANGNALLTWRNGEALSMTAGVEYEDQQQRGTSEYSDSFGTFPFPPIDVQRNNLGYFTQGIFSIGQAAITIGARLDNNSQFGSHGTYRAGLGYLVTDAVRLRVSAGSGFKEPTFFENYAMGFVRGNRHLDPERSRSWEAGIEYRGISVTYFNQEFRGLIEFSDTLILPDSVNYFNVGAATANGIETSVVARLSPSVAFDLRYTYLQTRVDESGSPNDPDGLFVPGKPLIRRPAHTVSSELTANRGRVHVMLGGRWVGSRDDFDFSRPPGKQRVPLEPYARVNFAAEYDLDRFVLSGRIDNVFNDQTQEIAGYRPRGRTALIGGRFALVL